MDSIIGAYVLLQLISRFRGSVYVVYQMFSKFVNTDLTRKFYEYVASRIREQLWFISIHNVNIYILISLSCFIYIETHGVHMVASTNK